MPEAITAAIGGSALLGIGGAALSADAAGDAADASAAASAASIAEQRRQFDALQELLSPYVEAGSGGEGVQGALQAQQDLLGLRGDNNQQAAISGIENSSMFETMLRQGEDGILSNASATGNLRGGNTKNALAEFRPALLNSLIQQQFSNLGGLTTIGQNSAAQTGVAGQNFANNASQIYTADAATQGNAALAQAAAFNQGLGSITNAIGLYGGNNSSGIFSGGSSAPLSSSGIGGIY